MKFSNIRALGTLPRYREKHFLCTVIMEKGRHQKIKNKSSKGYQDFFGRKYFSIDSIQEIFLQRSLLKMHYLMMFSDRLSWWSLCNDFDLNYKSSVVFLKTLFLIFWLLPFSMMTVHKKCFSVYLANVHSAHMIRLTEACHRTFGIVTFRSKNPPRGEKDCGWLVCATALSSSGQWKTLDRLSDFEAQLLTPKTFCRRSFCAQGSEGTPKLAKWITAAGVQFVLRSLL